MLRSVQEASTMGDVSSDFAAEYITALAEHLKEPREAALVQAYELGRKALSSGLGVLDTAKVHQEALATLLMRATALPEAAQMAKEAQAFFAETLSPFEMTHRGFRDAYAALQELNKTLEHRAGELAAANRELQNEITERKQAENSLRQLSGRLLELQDEERRRMARELHDTTGQTLAALAVNLSLVDGSTGKLEGRASKALGDAMELVEECSREIRTFSYLLHPPMLDELGLPAALRWYVDGFSKRSEIHVDLEIPAKGIRLPRDLELTIFRIVQESLANVHRHSGSATAQVCLAIESGHAALEIKDKGRGIGEGEMDLAGSGVSTLGVGIAGMRERVRQLGGRLEIRSSKKGTTVKAILPVEATS
ncbi:MAG TPA: sensor histidine kinase [Acidobacteriota bacterium]|jgi:signal transduction histidine kinase